MTKVNYTVRTPNIMGIHVGWGGHSCMLLNIDGVPYCGMAYNTERQGYYAGMLQKLVAHKTYNSNLKDALTFYPDYPEEHDNES